MIESMTEVRFVSFDKFFMIFIVCCTTNQVVNKIERIKKLLLVERRARDVHKEDSSSLQKVVVCTAPQTRILI